MAGKIREQKYDIEEFLMKNNTFNRSPEEIKMIFEVMISTCDLSEKIQKSKQSVPQLK
jgi:hypothetical protein